MTAASLVIK
jgi:hypothetical protein